MTNFGRAGKEEAAGRTTPARFSVGAIKKYRSSAAVFGGLAKVAKSGEGKELL
jgi:hypothetical protein